MYNGTREKIIEVQLDGVSAKYCFGDIQERKIVELNNDYL